MDTPVTTTVIRQAVQDLGLGGKPLCVHSSLGSFGPVEGGANTVVGALLAAGCTVLVPAFIDDFEIAPPMGMRPERNAWDYSDESGLPCATERVYTPDVDLINDGMGAIPRSIVTTRGRSRGDHPINSFAAVGPLAGDLVAGQKPDDVYAPLRALAAAGGYVVLMGVGLNRMTALHLAEQMAGRVLLRRWALGDDREPIMAEIGSCSKGFSNLDSALAPVERRRQVGQSLWRVFPLREALDLAANAIRREPEITHCANPGCVYCRDSIAGGPILA